MLKIVLQRSAELDRRLEAFTRSLSYCLSRGLEEGILKIYTYPSPDALVASSLLAFRASTEGIRSSLNVTYRLPQTVEGPTILIGNLNVNYKSSDVSDCLLAISYEDKLPTPPPGATYIEVDGSLSSAIALSLINEGWKGPKTIKLLSLIGTYSTNYVDKIGKIHGIDSILVESLSEHGISMVTSIKAYKPHQLTLCKALSITINPYYPYITGDEENCKKLFENAGKDELAERLPSSLNADELAKVSKIIMENVEGISKRRIDPSEYFGGILTLPQYPGDPRMAADALLASAEVLRDPLIYLASFMDFEHEYPIVESFLRQMAKNAKLELPNIRLRKIKGPGWLRIFAISDTSLSLTLTYRALKLLGLIDKESIIAYEAGKEILASPFQVDEALGIGSTKKLIESKAADIDQFFLKLRI